MSPLVSDSMALMECPHCESILIRLSGYNYRLLGEEGKPSVLVEYWDCTDCGTAFAAEDGEVVG